MRNRFSLIPAEPGIRSVLGVLRGRISPKDIGKNESTKKMVERSTVFEKTYRYYLEQIAQIDLKSIEEKLGIQAEDHEAVIPFFGEPYKVSAKGIVDSCGKRPSFDKCIILSKYLLLCPDVHPREDDWVSYRDLKNSGPLRSYFENEAERKIINIFSGKVRELERSCRALGGYPPDIELSYALSMQLDPLPRVPLLLLFNDADDEFPASCSVLFERRAEKFLDAECLSILAVVLSSSLKKGYDGFSKEGEV